MFCFEECSLQYSQQFYGEFDYQAKSWNQPRRVIVQVRRKAGELIPDYLSFSDETWKQDQRWLLDSEIARKLYQRV